MKNVYLSKEEITRLTAAIAKPSNKDTYFVGIRQENEDTYPDLVQLCVSNGFVNYLESGYRDTIEARVQVRVLRDIATDDLVIQYEDEYDNLLIKELDGFKVRRSEE